MEWVRAMVDDALAAEPCYKAGMLAHAIGSAIEELSELKPGLVQEMETELRMSYHQLGILLDGAFNATHNR